MVYQDYDVGTGTLGAFLRLHIETMGVSGNSTAIRYALVLHNVPSSTNIGTPKALSANIGIHGTDGNFTWASNTNNRVILDVTVWAAHDANGYLTLNVAGAIAATGTSGIGGPTNVSGVFVVPRIPKAPAQMAAPTLSALSSSSIRANFTPPDDNGAGITGYQLETADNAGLTGSTVVSDTASPYDFAGLLPGRTHYVRARASNSQGWGPWSALSSLAIGIGGRRFDGAAEQPFVVAKRWDGVAEVDIAVAKRWNGTAEVDIS